MIGTLTIIGVGPGDPELLTLKAFRHLAGARLVAFLSTGEGKAMAHSIAAPHLAPDVELLALHVPIAVEREPATRAYDEAAAALLERLRNGTDVALLCEGDPLFYGSAMYLLARIAPYAPIAVVPGVTAISAAAAAAQHPLVARNELFTVIPGPLPDDALRAELRAALAVAIMKVGRHFDRIRTLLVETGHAAAVVVEHATSPTEKVTALADSEAGPKPYFTTILSYRGAEDFVLAPAQRTIEA